MDKEIVKRIENTINAHKELVSELLKAGVESIAAAAEQITKTLKQNHTLYICGNGGSAADAQHIASELVGRFQCERRALPAVALTTDTSALTSISNDYGYENVFARQVEALVRHGDILWAISTSGTSPNVIAGIKAARVKDACILAFTGKTDSTIERLADICFCANSDSTARTQEVHQLAYHIICDLVEQDFAKP